MSGMKSASKGKWIPGSLESLRKTHGHGHPFCCEICERGFSNESSLEKHNSTELHFKRLMLRSKPEEPLLMRRNRIGYEHLTDSEGLPKQRKRRNVPIKNYADREVRKGSEDKVRCPTCYAHFHKQMMGKHLLSFFHCQRSEIEGRRLEPEKSLILENIHSVVKLSPYQCKPCSFYFTHRTQMLSHFEKNHAHDAGKAQLGKSGFTGWICSACRSRSYDAVGMMKHLENSPEHAKMEAAIQKSIPIVIKRINLFSCKSCGRNFVLNRELVSHRAACSQKRTSKLGRRYLCKNGCKEKGFGENQKCPEHDGRISGSPSADLLINIKDVRIQPVSGDSLLSCKVCEFTSKSRANFLRHMKIHDRTRKKSFRCEMCEASFYEKYQLNYHMKIHTGKILQCTFPGCDYSGRSNSEVNNHSLMHEYQKQFKCVKCEYITKTKSHLTRHSNLVHKLRGNPEKAFKCNQCKYSTNLPQGLKRHELTHVSDNVFFCPYCNYTSKSMDNIRVHVLKRKVHEGAVLYSCQICKLKPGCFTSNKFNSFKQHVVRHHSEDPHSTTDSGICVLAGLRKSGYPASPPEALNSGDDEAENVSASVGLVHSTPDNEAVNFTKRRFENTHSLLLDPKQSFTPSDVSINHDSGKQNSKFSVSPIHQQDNLLYRYSPPNLPCELTKDDISLVEISDSSTKEAEAAEPFNDLFEDLLTEESIASLNFKPMID